MSTTAGHGLKTPSRARPLPAGPLGIWSTKRKVQRVDLRNLIGLGRSGQREDAVSRSAKAARILELISNHMSIQGLRVLDFGAGAGYIAAHIQDAVGHKGHVVAADVVNQMRTAAVPFLQVERMSLSVNDGSFDLIISNHVLEHVGDADAQRRYLTECKRLLVDDGLLYLAHPNRWSVFEPHYRAPFLSWPPERYRNTYLRLLQRIGLCRRIGRLDTLAGHYGIRPLSRRQTVKLLGDCGYHFVDVTPDMIRLICARELGSAARLILAPLAYAFYWIFRPIVPTIIFVARIRQ